MKVETFSILVGDKRCNAHCPFCVSKMTCDGNLKNNPSVKWVNFHKAIRFAQINNVTTVILTGKGEPTLAPEMIKKYLTQMCVSQYKFPFIELQTNGILLPKLTNELESFYNLGLSTISLSSVHYKLEKNKEIYGDKYNDLKFLVKILHDIGFTVRVNCIMIKDYIYSIDKILEFAKYAKEINIDQLTFRPVTLPEINTSAKEVYDWIIDNKPETIRDIDFWHYGHELLSLPHGAKVYDYEGQNVCLSNCLTETTDPENIRQLIFFPNGELRYSWQYDGARLL